LIIISEIYFFLLLPSSGRKSANGSRASSRPEPAPLAVEFPTGLESATRLKNGGVTANVADRAGAMVKFKSSALNKWFIFWPFKRRGRGKALADISFEKKRKK
jgi:hypothetical protein